VGAEAEGDVRVGAAADVEGVGVVEHLLLAVGGRVEQHDPVALGHVHAGDLRRSRGGAEEVVERRDPADQFLDRSRHQRRIGGHRLPLVGVAGQLERPRAMTVRVVSAPPEMNRPVSCVITSAPWGSRLGLVLPHRSLPAQLTKGLMHPLDVGVERRREEAAFSHVSSHHEPRAGPMKSALILRPGRRLHRVDAGRPGPSRSGRRGHVESGRSLLWTRGCGMTVGDLGTDLRVIDADSHMTERHDLFTERAPKGWGGPRPPRRAHRRPGQRPGHVGRRRHHLRQGRLRGHHRP
jgi:hypothetical protein